MSEEEPEGRETLISAAAVRGNVILGQQSIEYADVQIRVEDAEHHRQIAQQQLDHDLSEAKKDNELRRQVFRVVVVSLIVILAVSGVVGIVNDHEDTRRMPQNVVTTMIGGLLGAIAGYFTAKGGK